VGASHDPLSYPHGVLLFYFILFYFISYRGYITQNRKAIRPPPLQKARQTGKVACSEENGYSYRRMQNSYGYGYKRL
jgi:hypothetical protein